MKKVVLVLSMIFFSYMPVMADKKVKEKSFKNSEKSYEVANEKAKFNRSDEWKEKKQKRDKKDKKVKKEKKQKKAKKGKK